MLSGRLTAVGSARIIWFSMLVLGLPQLIIPLAEPGWRLCCSRRLRGVLLQRRDLQRGAGQLPPGDLPAAPAGPDERRRPLGRLGHAPLGGALGGVFGTLLGVRPTLWIGFTGGWAAGCWVFFSPLRCATSPRKDPQKDPRKDAEGLEVDGHQGAGSQARAAASCRTAPGRPH